MILALFYSSSIIGIIIIIILYMINEFCIHHSPPFHSYRCFLTVLHSGVVSSHFDFCISVLIF